MNNNLNHNKLSSIIKFFKYSSNLFRRIRMINDKNDVKKADLKLKKSFNKNINEFNENKIKIISQKKFLDNYKKKLIDKIEENLKNKKLIHFYSESKNKNENEFKILKKNQ
jgi:hypothetical protein